MEICSIRIDFDKDILEVNGKKVEKPVTVALPEPDGWPIQKMFNPEVKPYEEYGRINIEVDKTDKTIKRAKKLVKLLKKANSLAEELKKRLLFRLFGKPLMIHPQSVKSNHLVCGNKLSCKF